MRWLALLTLCGLLAGAPSVGKAQIRLEITGEGGRQVPIAIVPLYKLGGESDRQAGEIFADVLGRDLDLSGYFRVSDGSVDEGGFSGIQLEDINFQLWSSLGILVLIKGGFVLDGDSLMVEVRLFDVAQRKQLGGKRYRGERQDLRRMAHRFADEIMLMLTGERGPFDSRIAFVSTRGGGRVKELYVADAAGEQIKAITQDKTLNLLPNWDPTASKLTYCSYKRGGPYPYMVDLRTGTQLRLVSTPGYSCGRWSPDGSLLAVSLEQDGNSDLFLLSPDGRIIKRLTERAGINISPSWSPDGRQLVFCSSRGGQPQIYVTDVDSGRTRRLTFQGSYNTSPAWSPKGDLIAYTNRTRGFRIMTIPVQGGEPREIAPGEDPSWSPDGRYVVFSYRGRLHLARWDGRSVKQLTGGGEMIVVPLGQRG